MRGARLPMQIREGGALRCTGPLLMLASLLAIGQAGVGECASACRQLSGDDLLHLHATGALGTEAGADDVLVLFHATPINSKESEAALETWKQLSGPLTGFALTATINCDEFAPECHALRVAHFPQAALATGGQMIFYMGPMTPKALFLFVTNNMQSPVYQLSAKKLDWWLDAEVEQDRKAVVLMHENLQMPAAFAAIARALRSSHAFAELRIVPEAVRERFHIQSLPALVMGDNKRGSFKLFKGDFKRGPLRAFLTGKSGDTETVTVDDEIVPAETYGMSQLGAANTDGSKGCVDTCIIIMTPHGSGMETLKERRRRIAVANDVLKAMRRGAGRKVIPTAVWASTAQVQAASALSECAGGADVSLAVWKVKRNRVAVLTGPLTATSGTKFLEDILAGNGNFKALPVDADMFLDRQQAAPQSWEGIVPPGLLTWTHASNIWREKQGAPPPYTETVVSPSDNAVLL